MADIAARAGLSKGTIYLYFESKEALFKGLLKQVAGTKLDKFIALAEANRGPIAPLFAQLLRGLGHLLATTDSAVLPKIVIAEAGNYPELARFHYDIVITRALSFLTALVARGQERGEFRPLPAEHVARPIVAPIVLVAIWRTTFAQFSKQPCDYPALIECHIQTLLDGRLVKPGGEP